MEMDASEIDTASNSFVFSKPNAVFDLSRVINFGVDSDHVFDTQVNKKNMFTFALPTIISQCNQSRTGSLHDEDRGERFGLEQWTNLNKSNKYKPRISRNTYKPTINVFTNALKDTGAFEQLEKEFQVTYH